MTISATQTTNLSTADSGSIFQAIKKPVIATLAVALIATTAFTTSTTTAEAGNKHRRAAAIVGGLLLGTALIVGSRNAHDDEEEFEAVEAEEDCWTEKHVYWSDGERQVRYEEVCP